MSAAKMREILRTEYGISNEIEFDAAVRKSPGINIGIFSTPLIGKGVENEHNTEARDNA